MRYLSMLAILAFVAANAPASAARAVASATIVTPAVVTAAPAVESPCVSVATLRDGLYEHVTIAFN